MIDTAFFVLYNILKKGDGKMKLHNYSIMPLNVDYIDEICEDIKFQYSCNYSVNLKLYKNKKVV